MKTDINRGSIIHVIDKDEPERKAPVNVPINIKKPEDYRYTS